MIISILFVFLITFGIGLPLTLLIVPKHNTVGRVGLSYILGIGLFTLLMFCTNLLGLKLTFINNIFIFLTVSIPLIFIERKSLINYWRDLKTFIKDYHPDLLEKIMLAAIVFLISSSFVATFYWPVYIWDSLTLYDFRAHLFAQTGYVNGILDASYGGNYIGYPLLTSLSHTVIYLTSGENPQIIYSLFYLSLGLVFYGLLRVFISNKTSLLFMLILISVPQVFSQSMVAYTNLPYMTLFSLGAIYFYIWDKKRTSGYLTISAILIGLSVWTRSAEPFWMGIFGLVILVSIFKKRFLDIFTFAAFFFPIQLMWESFKSSTVQSSSVMGMVTGSAIIIKYFSFQKLAEISIYLYQSMVRPWGPIFILFIMAFIYSLITKKIKTTYLMYLIVFILLVMVFAGTYVFSFTFHTWNEIPDSVSRMAMIFYPLFVYSVALTLNKTYNTKQNDRKK